MDRPRSQQGRRTRAPAVRLRAAPAAPSAACRSTPSAPTSATSSLLLGYAVAARPDHPRLESTSALLRGWLASMATTRAAARRWPAGVPRSARSSPGPPAPAASRATRPCGSRARGRASRCRRCCAPAAGGQLLDAARDRADDGDPVALRDWARARAAVRHRRARRRAVRRRRRTTSTSTSALLRVVGKGDKERVVPFGLPARTALAGVARARAPAARQARPRASALLLGRRGGRVDQRQVARGRRTRSPRSRGRRRRRAARAAPHRRDPPARGRVGPAQRPGAARSREPRHDAALHPRVRRAAPLGVRAAHPAHDVHDGVDDDGAAGRRLPGAHPPDEHWHPRASSRSPDVGRPTCSRRRPSRSRGECPARGPRSRPAGPPRRSTRCGRAQVRRSPAGTRAADPALRPAGDGRRRPRRHAPAEHGRAGRPRLVRDVRPHRRHREVPDRPRGEVRDVRVVAHPRRDHRRAARHGLDPALGPDQGPCGRPRLRRARGRAAPRHRPSTRSPHGSRSPVGDLRAIFSQLSTVNVAALDELLGGGDDRPGGVSLGDTLGDERTLDPARLVRGRRRRSSCSPAPSSGWASASASSWSSTTTRA